MKVCFPKENYTTKETFRNQSKGADGSIDPGLQSSLSSKLENADKKLDKGQTNAAANEMQAFINHVQAQRGKKITESAADDLRLGKSSLLN